MTGSRSLLGLLGLSRAMIIDGKRPFLLPLEIHSSGAKVHFRSKCA